jgi:PAS domain S-box-containing protein
LRGYTPEEVLAQSPTEALTPVSIQVMQAALAIYMPQILQGAAHFNLPPMVFELEQPRKDGSTVWTEAMMRTLFDESGAFSGFLGVSRDITARKQADAALRESEARYQDLYENAPDMYLSVEPQTGQILQCNQTVTRLTGFEKQALMGRPVFELYHPACLDAARRAMYRFVATGEVHDAELQVRRQDGGRIDVSLNVSAVRDATGQIVQSRSSWRDITTRKRIEDALRESHAELQTRNEELDAFAHTVAHDLKNPLGVMMGYAELLAEDYGTLPTDMVQQALVAINRSGQKASGIIESLLMLASVRQQDVQAEPLDMVHLVNEVLLRLADAIQDSGADLCVPDPARWPVALGYAPWIEEIWINYLSNALKYGGQPPRIDLDAARLPPLSATARKRGQGGGFIPPLSATARKRGQGGGFIPPLSATGEGQGGGFIRFSVRDHGPGLTPEQQARLFAPFERLGQAQIEGHGLGLSVVRRIADKLGGQVGVDSQPGQGSTFYFTLPAAPDR